MGQVETVAAVDRDGVVARVLAPAGGAARATGAQVKSFVRYMSVCDLQWTAWRHRQGDRETALVFVLFLPGETAIAMFPAPETRSIVPEDQRRLLTTVLERIADRRLHYVQALVEPEARGKRDLLQASGFMHLTQLIYLQRGASFPWFDSPGAYEATWIAYNETRHGAFARMLLATYEDSHDCPELTPLRPVDAVIASHKAAGKFDPALWELACVNGEHVGCILLSPLAHGPLLELVYIGVEPGWRQRGVGKLLLRRALEHCRAAGARELTAVVDCRNSPARQLYAHFGFRPTAAREAYIYSR